MARTEIRGGQIQDATVGLTADVTGVLPTANGGTGASSITGAGIVDTSTAQTLTNKTLTDPKVNALKDTNGAALLDFTQRGGGTAVNNVKVSNGAAGQSCGVEMVGADADLAFLVIPKGTGAGLLIFEATGQATANIQAIGSATDVGLNLVSQGAGVVSANSVPLVSTTGAQSVTNKTFDNTNTVNTWACAPNVLSTSQTVTAACSTYLPDLLEIGTGIACEVGAASVLEIG